MSDPLWGTSGAISYRSEERLHHGREASAGRGVPQLADRDQNVVRPQLPELLSRDWDLGNPKAGRWIAQSRNGGPVAGFGRSENRSGGLAAPRAVGRSGAK